MKVLKRIGTLVLVGVMVLSTLTGCGAGKKEKETQTKETQAIGGEEQVTDSNNQTETISKYDADGNWTGDTTRIVMTLITGGVDPVDLKKVQDAVNEVSIKKEGVEVEFRPVSVFEAPSQVPMWIGAGEQVDLMACSFTGISPYVAMNMIEPLEELLKKYAPDLEEMNASGISIYDTTSKEHVYGVRTLATIEGNAGGFMMPKDILDELGFSYKNWDKITLDDLDGIFAKVKTAYPDSYMGIIGSIPTAKYSMVADTLGATTASGVLIGTDSTTVENYFASDEYYNYLKHVRSWNENGYLLKDAATTNISLSDGAKNGTILGNFTEGNYGLLDGAFQNSGKEYIALLINDPYQPSLSPELNTYWTVPVTSSEPEAAVRFLNLMMSDSEVSNLLMWGIEGEHYTLTEEGTIVVTENSIKWSVPGLHGNQRISLGNGIETKVWDDKWNEMSALNVTKGFGFTYNASAMTNQLTAIQAVITEYQAALETGSVDLDTVYPEFLKKLEDNGINDVIADKQAQFDTWLAE